MVDNVHVKFSFSAPGGQILRTQGGGMMDMAGLSSLLAQAGAGAGAITASGGQRISLEGEPGDTQAQPMEVSAAVLCCESKYPVHKAHKSCPISISLPNPEFPFNPELALEF